MAPDRRKRPGEEVFTVILMLGLLVLILRLWPILLLMIIGLFAYALWLLAHLNKKPEEPMPPLLGLPAPASEQTVIHTAFLVLQRRVTEQVTANYPSARWTWCESSAQSRFAANEPLMIMLNGAGGYRMAMVQTNNLQFQGLVYQSRPQPEPRTPDDGSEEAPSREPPEDASIDYGLLAFEWVEANLQRLSAQEAEAASKNQSVFHLPAEELPHGDSWPLVCAELVRNGFAGAEVRAGGIQVQINTGKGA